MTKLHCTAAEGALAHLPGKRRVSTDLRVIHLGQEMSEGEVSVLGIQRWPAN